MNGLSFIAAVVQALAWPIVVLAVVLVFQRPIRGLLSAPVRRLKAGPSGFELEIVRGIAEAETQISLGTPKLPPPTPELAPRARSVKAELAEVARQEPARAILEGHERVYQRLIDVVGPDRHVPGPLPRTAAAVARVASAEGLISPEVVKAVEAISTVRNMVAHGGPDVLIGPERALDYLSLVDAILQMLDPRPSILPKLSENSD